MEEKLIRLLRDVMNIQGIAVQVWRPPYENREDFDAGLRRHLYENYDYRELFDSFIAHCREYTIHLMKDQFHIHYIILKGPADLEQDQPVIASIGPYLTGEGMPNLPELTESSHLPLYCIPQLQDYYYSVPVAEDESQLEALISALLQYTWAGYGISVDRGWIAPLEHPELAEYRMEGDNSLSLSLIEERYHIEDEMLRAMEHGDADRTFAYLAALAKFRTEPRTKDSLRNSRNNLVIMNSLYRRAVSKANVHPAHIDRLSSLFARRIESSAGAGELTRLHKEMVRKYCLLVQNYSLKSYSLIVQNAINYIDFNVSIPMTLKGIAEKVLVNSSYLSSQFKKETGKNLTDYINQKKIETSLTLLATTELPIHEVAERVGIYDENYFSRLFKRSQNMTAREYRNIVKGRK